MNKPSPQDVSQSFTDCQVALDLLSNLDYAFQLEIHLP